MRLRRMRHLPHGGLPEALPQPNKCVPRPSVALSDSPLVQRPHPNGVRAVMGVAPVRKLDETLLLLEAPDPAASF